MRRKDANNKSEKLQAMLKAASDNNEIRRRPEQAHLNFRRIQEFPANKKQQIFLKVYPGQKVHGFRLIYIKESNKSVDCCNVYTRLTLGDIECLRLANNLRMESNSDSIWQFHWQYTGPDWKGMLKPRSSVNSSPDDTLRTFVGSTWLTRRFNDGVDILFWTGLFAAGSVYGVAHLLAWDGPFATAIERWMWRSSCFLIATPGVLILLGFAVFVLCAGVVWVFFVRLKMHNWWIFEWAVVKPIAYCYDLVIVCHKFLPRFWQDTLESAYIVAFMGTFLGSLAIFALAYVAARIYLIVECFINLAHLPAAVYQEPEWSQYIPHFSSG